MGGTEQQDRIPNRGRAVMWKTPVPSLAPTGVDSCAVRQRPRGPGAPSRDLSPKTAIDRSPSFGDLRGSPNIFSVDDELDDDPGGLVLCKEERTLLRERGPALPACCGWTITIVTCLSQFLDGLLDCGGSTSGRGPSRAPSIRSTLGSTASETRNAEPLLLAARQCPAGRVLSRSPHLFPRDRARVRALLHDLIPRRPA